MVVYLNPQEGIPVTDEPRAGSAPELLELLTRQSRDHALILLDPRGRVTGWLAAAEHIFGWTAADVLGEPLDRMFTPEDLARGLHTHELEVARGHGRAEDDRWQLRKDGTRIWVFGVLTGLRDRSGELVGFGKVLRDRTDVKAQIEAWRQEGERARAALSTVAHELRGPLSALSNVAHILRAAGDSGGADAAGLIGRQVGLLRRLADDLMDAARVGAGKVRLAVEPVDLLGLLRNVAAECRPGAEAHGQDFRAILPEGPIALEADPARLRQVVVNLLTNAFKYTPAGGQIVLKATVEGDEAVVRVQDTGVGIAPEMLPKIFDLFTQEECARDRSEGGLGIGLAVVRELVALHGGTVQVRSEGKGKGSDFAVRLPLGQTRAGPGPDLP
jgi:PAS domain S-box-containing protein